MQILKRLLYVVLIVPIFFVYGLVSAQLLQPSNTSTTTPNFNPIPSTAPINTNQSPYAPGKEPAMQPIQPKTTTPLKTNLNPQAALDNGVAKMEGFDNAAQKKKYDNCVKTRSVDGKENQTIKEACTCIAKGGILLSSDVPGTTNGSVIKGRCVYTNGDTVSVANQIFSMITRIVMIILGITIFGMIVWGGMQFVIFAGSDDGPKKGKAMIKNAIIAGFAVSMIGVVLKFINPNIFK